jgi:hypothetical protein
MLSNKPLLQSNSELRNAIAVRISGAAIHWVSCPPFSQLSGVKGDREDLLHPCREVGISQDWQGDGLPCRPRPRQIAQCRFMQGGRHNVTGVFGRRAWHPHHGSAETAKTVSNPYASQVPVP